MASSTATGTGRGTTGQVLEVARVVSVNPGNGERRRPVSAGLCAVMNKTF
jgi:hypothetical protein